MLDSPNTYTRFEDGNSEDLWITLSMMKGYGNTTTALESRKRDGGVKVGVPVEMGVSVILRGTGPILIILSE